MMLGRLFRALGWFQKPPAWTVVLPRAGFWDVFFAHIPHYLADDDGAGLLDGSGERRARDFRQLVRMVERLGRRPDTAPAERVRGPDGQLIDNLLMMDCGPWRAFVILGETEGVPVMTVYAVLREDKTIDQQLTEVVQRLAAPEP